MEWFKWARENRHTLPNLRIIESKIEEIAESISAYLKGKGQSVEKDTIFNELLRQLSYPLFLLMTVKGFKDVEKEKYVPGYDEAHIKAWQLLAREDLERIIKKLTGTEALSEGDNGMINGLINELIKSNNLESAQAAVVPRYPSNEFVIQLVDKDTLYDLYDSYSYFIHSYVDSWSIFPFSSVLEFMIFSNEFKYFSQTIYELLNSYFQHIKSNS